MLVAFSAGEEEADEALADDFLTLPSEVEEGGETAEGGVPDNPAQATPPSPKEKLPNLSLDHGNGKADFVGAVAYVKKRGQTLTVHPYTPE